MKETRKAHKLALSMIKIIIEFTLSASVSLLSVILAGCCTRLLLKLLLLLLLSVLKESQCLTKLCRPSDSATVASVCTQSVFAVFVLF